MLASMESRPTRQTRQTRQKDAVLRSLADSGRSLAPAEILELARAEVPTLNLSTVYRQLRALHEELAGFVVLDPACGSGHFLVIAMDLLFALYQEEARHRGVVGQDGWTEREIVEAILERNLFGLDIDPRAVQIAAAAVMLKARTLCKDATPRTLNLVAPALGLADLPKDDPARVELLTAVEAETGLPQAVTARVLDALAGARRLAVTTTRVRAAGAARAP